MEGATSIGVCGVFLALQSISFAFVSTSMRVDGGMVAVVDGEYPQRVFVAMGLMLVAAVAIAAVAACFNLL
jgi:hypothetical protein